LIKGKNKENKWEIKNTSNKQKNHGMQNISIRVCGRHIILNDPHGNEQRLSETRLEFRELFGINIFQL
jgi:hypothetical protein